MEGYIFGSGDKTISFPLEEYVKAYKTEPEGFEAVNVIAQALGCFCFCLAAGEILGNSEIQPSFNNPECGFVYLLSDFEENYIQKLSLVRKNKLLAGKNYAVNFEKEGLICGKAFISFKSLDKNRIKIEIKLEFQKVNPPVTKIMEVLFETIWAGLFPEINKSQKSYTPKTINFVPDYLKFATAPFVQELRRLMTSEKNKIVSGNSNVIAEKITNAGSYVFKYSSDEEINILNTAWIGKMNDLTVDVLNGIIHILMDKSQNDNLEAVFCVDDLLFIRGKKASKNNKGARGGYKDSQRNEILEHLKLLAKIRISVSDVYIPAIIENERSYSPYRGESPVIYLEKIADKENYFYVKAGEVLALSLRGMAAKTGLIHKKIAEYDYYRNYWEKRIGNYLAWIWRNRQNKAEFLVPFTVRTLLNQVEEGNNSKRPQYMRDRLENALDKLEDDGVIKSWQYKNIDEAFLTGRNWREYWLKLMLIIEPPVEILEEYAKIKKIRNKGTNRFDFQEIIRIIKEKKVSQMRIAEETGIKQEVLSGVLSGKILPNQSEKRKLKNWVMKHKS